MPMLYGIFLSVTALTEASRHLLKRQGKKLKRHGAVTLGRFGGNPALFHCTHLFEFDIPLAFQYCCT